MDPRNPMDRPIELRDYHDDAELEGSDQYASDDGHSQSGESVRSDSDPEHETAESASLSDEGASLKDISFGALAKAQATFGPGSRKRKLAAVLEESAPDAPKEKPEDFFSTRLRSKEARLEAPKRTSKHAPAVESARKPVSRKRAIFEPAPALKYRDPRFDPTVMSANRDRSASERANKNYSFLSEYQATEILDLKSQLKKAKDPDTMADLKRTIMSMESKLRAAEGQRREAEIRKRHKKEQKEALSTGQRSQPFYLKEADVKKLAKAERLEGMGKRARDKAEKRRLKREKGKEARYMPKMRREG